MTTTVNDPYPEHTRQHAVLDDSQAIGAFLDESRYLLAEYRDIEGCREQHLIPVSTPVHVILAEYFGIDLAKIEAEKRAMIAAIQTASPNLP